jgi:integrase
VLVRALTRLQEDGRLALGSRFTIHDARRTWRTWAGELRVPFEVAEKSRAHVLPGVAATYAHVDRIEERAEAAELVAAAFDRIRLGEAAHVAPIASATRG